MGRTANLRRQHDMALHLISEIGQAIRAMGPAPTRPQAYALTLQLAKLTGMMKIHAMQERELLYPTLLVSEHDQLAILARAFFDELDDFIPDFMAFSERWRSPDAIMGAPGRFHTECAALFETLSDRMQRENDELYPLADAAALQFTPRRGAFIGRAQPGQAMGVSLS